MVCAFLWGKCGGRTLKYFFKLIDNGVLPMLIINLSGAGGGSVFVSAFVVGCCLVVEYFFFTQIF